MKVDKNKLKFLGSRFGFYPPPSVFVDEYGNVKVLRRRRIPEREIYGFVAWIVIVFSYILFLMWSFLPSDIIEEQLGITYGLPNKNWSLRISTYLVFLILCLDPYLRFFQHFVTLPLDSKNTFVDEDSHFLSEEDLEVTRQVPPMRDIPIELVNEELFHKKRV